MTLTTHPTEFNFCEESGPPWHLSCSVKQVGADYVCFLHGGDWHVGAVALSQHGSGRAITRSLVVGGHKEEEMAIEASHRLCRAGHSSVVVIAGIHFESLDKQEIEEITSSISRLTARAAEAIRDRRLRNCLKEPGGVYARIKVELGNILHHVEEFFSTPLEETVATHTRTIASYRTEHFANRVRVFAPLYLSNACINDCVYCGFRRGAGFSRKKLKVEEAVAEALVLARDGHRTIDLVTGEVPTPPFVEYVCKCIETIRANTPIHHINLNLGALSPALYAELKMAGASGYHLYQETYHADTYFQVHPRGLKRNMARRLKAPHDAVEGGFTSVGLGILLGLHPLREDLSRLVRHAEILLHDHPDIQLGFSLPRIQGTDASRKYKIRHPVTDDEFLKAMLFLRLKFPKAHLTVTTRERPEIRDRLIHLGISKISAGVSTAPGGYAAVERHETSQFQITDMRSVSEMVAAIEEAGLTVTFD